MLGNRLASHLPWLEAVADAVQPLIREPLRANAPLRNALDGVWLGNPLHPALTDVPVGAATTAALLDLGETLTGSAGLQVAADRSLAVSVLAAIPAVATGASDWRELRGETRRVGTLHGLLNATAVLLNVGSLALRAGGRRGAGKVASGAGLAIASLAAHIGGELTFGDGVRVNRTAWQSAPDEWTECLGLEVGPRALRKCEVDGVPVLVARVDGELCAIAHTCSHLGGPLADGKREGDTVVCPWHASRFELRTGAVVDGPAVYDQPVYDVDESGGTIRIRPRRS